MNTQDYINELKMHLRKLPDADREDAISYYFEYLAEAGPDGAAAAMERLGNPARLAAGIRADQAMLEFGGGPGFANAGEGEPSGSYGGGATVTKGVKAVWLAGLAAVPRTAFAGFVTAIVIAVFFTVMVALFGTSIGVIGGGAIGVYGGVSLFFLDGATGAFYFGCGLACVGAGILLFRFSVWCSKHLLYAIAAVFNGIRRSRAQKIAKRASRYNGGNR
jgi:uncharacterized membrane protein